MDQSPQVAGRSVRRHHRLRLKRKRAGYWGKWQKSARQLGVLASTPTPCSCWMCRNRRKTYGPTLQERAHWRHDPESIAAN